MVKAIKEDTSATVTISKSGREKARMLEESSKKDDYMKNAESKIDKILDTIRDGGTLSKEEEELVNNELKNMSEQKYKDYKDLRLNPEDVMMELKENYLRRERLFFDMQEQIETDAKNQLDDFDTEKIMAYMQEKEYDEEIIEMVEEYAEDDYKRIQQVLNNDEVVIEDKVKAYDRFVSEAGKNARGREVQRIKKQFDAETLMMAKIMFSGQNRMDNIIKGNVDHSQIGTEFIKSFLV